MAERSKATDSSSVTRKSAQVRTLSYALLSFAGLAQWESARLKIWRPCVRSTELALIFFKQHWFLFCLGDEEEVMTSGFQLLLVTPVSL